MRFIQPPKRSYQNTYRSIIKVLNEKPYLSENEIMIEAFDYDRNTSYQSNKKYADMLRRTLRRGEIRREKANVEGSKATYFYYLNGERRHLSDVRKVVSSSINKKDKDMKNQAKETNKTLMINVEIPFEVGSVKGIEQYQVCLYENEEGDLGSDIDHIDTYGVTFHGMEVQPGYENYKKLVKTFSEYGVDLNKEIEKQVLEQAKVKAEELKVKYKALLLM